MTLELCKHFHHYKIKLNTENSILKTFGNGEHEILPYSVNQAPQIDSSERELW